MSDLKEIFRDGTKIPTGEKFSSKQEGFIEAFNDIFGFHDSSIISSKLSFKKRNLNLLVNYIVQWREERGRVHHKWRKLLLCINGVDFLNLGNSDPEHGILVYVTHTIGLINFRTYPQAARQLQRRYPYKLKGAELNSLELQSYSSMGFPKVRVIFDWITANRMTWVPKKAECSEFSLEFKSEARDDRW